MKARQAVIVEPFKVEVRDVDLPDPAENQVVAPLALALQLPVGLYFIFLVRCFPRRPVERVELASITKPAA